MRFPRDLIGGCVFIFAGAFLLSCGGGGTNSSLPPPVQAVSISVSPQTTSVQVFRTTQFGASVKGTTNTTVTWSVNGTQGGSLSNGQIDNNGLYTAPNQAPANGTVTVTATSQADSSKNANATVTINPDTAPPTIVSISPANGATGISQLPTITVVFSKSLDPATINASSFTFSRTSVQLPSRTSYDPTSNTVAVAPIGALEAGFVYTVSVGTGVRDLAGNPMASAFTSSFTTQAPASASAAISLPPGVDPSSVTVLSYAGSKTVPDRLGNATISLRPLGTTLVASMLPGKPFGLLALAIGQQQSAASKISTHIVSSLLRNIQARSGLPVQVTKWQITASPRSTTSADAVTTDFQTTAESLVFLTPYLFHADPGQAEVIMSAIASDPNTALLAQALAAAWNESDPLQNATVQSCLQNATASVLQTLTATTTKTTQVQVTQRTQPTNHVANRPNLTNVNSADVIATGLPQVTPNCWSDSGHTQPITNGLQCLDLEVISLNQPTSADQSDNYDFAPDNQNCGEALVFGCTTGWLGEVAPITSDVPNGGVNAIVPGQGSNGPDSPTDAFAPNCVFPNSSAQCTAVFWMPGESRLLRWIDPEGAMEAAVEAIAGTPTAQPGFSVSAANQQNYVARFYSGGLADSTEFSDVLAGSYTSGASLWSTALAFNAMAALGQFLDATGVVPPDVLSCTMKEFATTQMIPEVAQIQQRFSASNPDYPSLLFTTSAEVLGDFAGDVGNCLLDDATDNLFKLLLELAKLGVKDVSVIPKVLTAASNVGQITQTILEMSIEASPLETAIISVGPPPVQVSSLQISCGSSTMTVGQNQTCTAKAFDTQGNLVPPSQMTIDWSSSSPTTVVRLRSADPWSSMENVFATGPGKTIVSVAAPRGAGGPFVQNSISLTVNQSPLAQITLVPSSITVSPGQVYSLAVLGTDSSHNPVNIGTAAWQTSNQSVATVFPSAQFPNLGQLQTISAGSTTITASVNGLTATASVTVSAAPIGTSAGAISTVAGGGSGCAQQTNALGDGCPALNAVFNEPVRVAFDAVGNMYIADYNNNRIRAVNTQSAPITLFGVTIQPGLVATVAGGGTGCLQQTDSVGDGCVATSASLNLPDHICIDLQGNIFIADSFNQRVRKMNASTAIITTVAGNGIVGYAGDGGSATSAEFNYPWAVEQDGAGNLYIVDIRNNVIRMVSATTGIISTVAGNGIAGYSGDGGRAVSAQLNGPIHATVSQDGTLYIADGGNNVIRMVNPSSGIITTVAGNGIGGYGGDGGAATSAELHSPTHVTVDDAGDLFVTDWGNNVIRMVNATSKVITTVIGGGSGCPQQTDLLGDGCSATSAILNEPTGISLQGANLYFTDAGSNRVRVVTAIAP